MKHSRTISTVSALVFCLLALLAASAVVTAIERLNWPSVGNPSDLDLAADRVLKGQLHVLPTLDSVTYNYPLAPTQIAVYLDPFSLGLVAAAIALSCWCCHRFGRSLLYLTLIAVPLAVIPYAIGTIVLSGNSDAVRAAFWIKSMLAGLLYASLWTFVCAGGYVIRRGQRRAGFCPDCGYDLRASRGKCPECGAAIEGSERG